MAKYFRIIVIRVEEIESSGAIDCSVILVPLSSILGWYVTVGAVHITNANNISQLRYVFTKEVPTSEEQDANVPREHPPTQAAGDTVRLYVVKKYIQ